MTCTVLLALVTLGSCNGLAGNDEMDRYFQRSDTITLSAGDAKQANAVTHTINPWPPGVGDRRIVSDARRVSSAVTRYSTNQRPLDTLPDIGQGECCDGPAASIQPEYQYQRIGGRVRRGLGADTVGKDKAGLGPIPWDQSQIAEKEASGSPNETRFRISFQRNLAS